MHTVVYVVSRLHTGTRLHSWYKQQDEEQTAPIGPQHAGGHPTD